MRRIGVVTVARSDYGLLTPLLHAIQEDDECELCLIVGGMHLAPEFGLTERAIAADGFRTDARVEMLLSSDDAEGTAKSMGLGILGFAQELGRLRPDILVVLGDRFEMHAAASAAVPFGIPLAHLYGGELTTGAFDDQFRHSMTKLSHLHFVSTDAYRKRVLQMGEEPWRVVLAGALAVDNVRATEIFDRAGLEGEVGIPADQPFLLVTFHPPTLELEQAPAQLKELLSALPESGLHVVFTASNADPTGRVLNEMIRTFVGGHKWAQLVSNLGTKAYLSAMSHATAMVGNSSSGMVEAASYALPVVNIGTRQQGRERTANVIDVGYGHEDIAQAIARATSDGFRASLRSLSNPYGNGDSAITILSVLRSVPLDGRLMRKLFQDWDGSSPGVEESAGNPQRRNDVTGD